MPVNQEVWITGIGLVTALGEGIEAQWAGLATPETWRARIDSTSFAPFHIHPVAGLDLDRQIPKKGDQRAMGPLMHYGVYAAGLALADAGIAGDADALGKVDISVASPGGERDIAADEQIFAAMEGANDPGRVLNERLLADLRPTLFLAQLPNLFAGNISIVHGAIGSSRTFMGEEAAGIAALRNGFLRVRAGQSEISLVGGCFNAARADSLLLYGPGGYLLDRPWAPLWSRPPAGMTLGSMGAFLVLEPAALAARRGRRPHARLLSVLADQTDRQPDAASRAAERQLQALPPMETGGLAILSGASGAGAATEEERRWLAALAVRRGGLAVRGTAAALGHGMEASFLANLALAASCAERGALFPPLAPEDPLESETGPIDRVLVTGWGHHRGEGLALVEAAR
jgi:3-oxoacyl-[acyl-carrier-protein] synthase II